MILKNPGTLSSLNFHLVDGVFIERPDYLVIKTPSRPRFFWGNFIIFHRGPEDRDLSRWLQIYEREFDVREQKFVSLTWDYTGECDLREFVDHGFEVTELSVLKLSALVKPPGFNEEVKVRPLQSDEDWQQLRETQWIHDWPLSSPQEDFLTDKIRAYQRLQQHGYGKRLGAFLGEKLVGDLGIYTKQGIGRFNNVSTHKDFYNQGVCRTLVYWGSRYAIEQMGARELVIEVLPKNHASRIYQSTGFVPVDKSYELTWMENK